jgi:2'-5' RNA ligase
MTRIAIDVALLPSEEMMEKAIEINQELRQNNEEKIILSKEGCLPHISLCMGVIDTTALPEVNKILTDIAEDLTPLNLSAAKIYAVTSPTGEKISGIRIASNDRLQKLHENIMNKLKPYLSYDVAVSMLYQSSNVEEVTLSWIRRYADNHDNPSLFNPHITVGIGETDKFVFPINFTASTIALCQLGNYCTCQKVITKFEL